MSKANPEAQLPDDVPQDVRRDHRAALSWVPWWVPMWVPIVTVSGVLVIAAVMYLVLISPLEL
jgi:hypothetical protein